MKIAVVIVLVALFAIVAAQVAEDKPWRGRSRWGERREGRGKREGRTWGRKERRERPGRGPRRPRLSLEDLMALKEKFAKRRQERRQKAQLAVEDDFEADFPIVPVALGAYRVYQGYQAGKAIGNAINRWRGRDDFDEEADRINWDRISGWISKGKQIYDMFKRRDDFDEEADAEFFKKLGGWFKRNFTPENVQKGLDIYRTIKGGDDMEESDAEFFKKLGGWFKRNFTPENVQKGLDIYRTIKGGDDMEEADAEFFKKFGGWFKKNFTPENIQKGMDIYRTIRGGDDIEESDAEFFKKMKGFLSKAGGIAKKGLGLYQQYGGLLRI